MFRLIQWAHIGFALFCIYGSFSKNRLLWKSELTQRDVARARFFDKVTASMAGLLVLSGVAMMFWFAKPLGYYTANGLFWLKLALFGIASGLVVWTKRDLKLAVASGVASWIPSVRVRAILAFDLIGLFCLAWLGRVIAGGTAI